MNTATLIIWMLLIPGLVIIVSKTDWKSELSDLIELLKQFKEDEI